MTSTIFHPAPVSTGSGPAKPFRALRVMIVDDNHINLAMLGRLLKRKFSHVLDGEPVAVDSALKAIQLLQQRIFDVILMDIQMPFLNGLEATMRIRNAEDGILQANSTAHVVAVTTAIGAEPEAAYRRAGMDGMIGKPVRQQDIETYLNSLSQEAFIAFEHIEPMRVGGCKITPPLPPTTRLSERAFYMPADPSIRSPVDDICADSGFERALHSQTLDSLKQSGRTAIAETQEHDVPAVDTEDVSVEPEEATDVVTTDTRDFAYPRPKHMRGASLNFEQLGHQIARELANVGDKQRKTLPLIVRTNTLPTVSVLSLPSSPVHSSSYSDGHRRASSYQVHGDELTSSFGDSSLPEEESEYDCADVPSLCSSSDSDARRPSNQSSSSSSSDATASDDCTDITTPTSEVVTSPFETDEVSPFDLKTSYFHCRSASTSTAGNFDDDVDAYSTDSTATDQTLPLDQMRGQACKKRLHELHSCQGWTSCDCFRHNSTRSRPR